MSMTIEEARNKYGSRDDGYVLCCMCPLNHTDDCLIDDTGDCSGLTDVHEAIANYMTDKEVKETDKTPDPTANPEPTDTPNDIINHPSHYCREDAMESIDEMVLVFGRTAVMHFCLCNVWKYRYRSSEKNGTEDLKKSDWYMKKYKELSDE